MLQEVIHPDYAFSGSPRPASAQPGSRVAAPSSCSSNIADQVCTPQLTANTTSCLGSAGADAIAGPAPTRRSGVFTRSAMREGDMLAVIPLSLAHKVKEGNEGLLVSIACSSTHATDGQGRCGCGLVQRPWRSTGILMLGCWVCFFIAAAGNHGGYIFHRCITRHSM